MDSSAVQVFMAGPFPIVHSAHVEEGDVDLDVALLIGGIPTILAATTFPLDDSWKRIDSALASGDARLGVAGVPHEGESMLGLPEVYPSAYVGLECANGDRLVLAHIRGSDAEQDAETYAREVIGAILQGQTPAELGEVIDE